MPASALAFALAAAFVHALWNILLARARNPEAATAVALLVAVVVFAPIAAAVWKVDARVWPFLIATSAFELLYFALLAAAYRRAHLSVVYPLARGTAPVFVLVVGVVVLGAGTSWRQVGGARDVLFWLPIAGCIATYTLIDKHGIRYSTPLVYLELSMIVPALAYAGAVAVAQGRESLRTESNLASVVAGLATFGAYALVLAALERASAASVAAVRETSVVIATALAAMVLKEPVGRVRMSGAVLVAGGVALISLT